MCTSYSASLFTQNMHVHIIFEECHAGSKSFAGSEECHAGPLRQGGRKLVRPCLGLHDAGCRGQQREVFCIGLCALVGDEAIKHKVVEEGWGRYATSHLTKLRQSRERWIISMRRLCETVSNASEMSTAMAIVLLGCLRSLKPLITLEEMGSRAEVVPRFEAMLGKGEYPGRPRWVAWESALGSPLPGKAARLSGKSGWLVFIPCCKSRSLDVNNITSYVTQRALYMQRHIQRSQDVYYMQLYILCTNDCIFYARAK